MRSAQSAAALVRELYQLTERLAARDICVGSFHAEYDHFGDWQLVANRHDEAVRFRWAGRDGFLTIESAVIEDHRCPDHWRQDLLRGFDRIAGDDPVRFVEDYLRTKFPI